MATTTPADNRPAESIGPAEAAGPTPTQLRSHWEFAWHRLKRDRFALAGGVVVVLLFVLAAAAPYLPLHNPLTQFPDGLTGQFAVPIPPGESRFLLGTDPLGRDFLSRLVWGGRISLTVALVANVTSISLAILVGAIAGYLGGWLDTLIMRFVDLFLSFPALLLQIALATVLPPSLLTVILVITLFGWVFPARIFRGQVLSLREQNYVEAARAVGAGELRIFFTHILPQLWPTVIVFSTLRVPAAILTEAGLSFVGLGVRPPSPSWGNLILEGFRYFRSAPWLIILPGLAIMLAVMSFNLLGDGLRDALDPREQQTAQVQGQR